MINKYDFQDITIKVVDLCRTTGQWIQNELAGLNEKDIEYKGTHNLVTYVDKTAENMLIEALQKLVPEAGFIAEEDDQLIRKKGFNWIVDPLDGTTNFIHKIPLFSISIALTEGDITRLGVVYEINLKEAFYAWDNGPAMLNGNLLKVSETHILDKALLATGFPYFDYSYLDAYLALFKDMMQNSRGVRRLGSAAVDLAYVAAGRFDLFYEYGLNPWDVAAGAFIVQQAGGQITTFSGNNDFVFGKEIVASNREVHQEFLQKIALYFK